METTEPPKQLKYTILQLKKFVNKTENRITHILIIN